ncbi:MAG: nucleoside deaminase [Chitinophagaceae bacterium]|nr:MAG: nucleoside deaminase [Chitinophagaceae bacterium]
MENLSNPLSVKELGFLERAIELSRQAIEDGHGGPFGCVIVKDDEIIGEGCNMVTSSNDPTAHAEVVAIREACKFLGHYQLDDCELYTSCEPCPMCLGAIYWARPCKVIYANTKQDAAAIAFDDAFIYDEISADMHERKIPFVHYAHAKALEVFTAWKNKPGKKIY